MHRFANRSCFGWLNRGRQIDYDVWGQVGHPTIGNFQRNRLLLLFRDTTKSGTYLDMSIRDAKTSDASSIAAISIEVWIGTYLKQGVNSFFADFALEEFTTANIESQLNDQSQFCLVSENEIGIDGFVRVSYEQEAPVDGCSDTEIATFYVQPRHHGKGIGKRLLKAAIERCRAKGIHAVWLTTNSENTPGIAFYLSQGFDYAGETHFRIDDQAYLNNVYSYSF